MNHHAEAVVLPLALRGPSENAHRALGEEAVLLLPTRSSFCSREGGEDALLPLFRAAGYVSDELGEMSNDRRQILAYKYPPRRRGECMAAA